MESRIVVTPPSPWDRATVGGLLAILRENRDVHGRLTIAARQTLLIHRLGEWADDPARHAATRAMTLFAYRVGSLYARNVLGFEILKGAKIGRRVHFTHQHGVVIAPETEIGDDCLIHHDVTIGLRLGRDHSGDSIGARIGAGVRISAGARILGNVSIGDGASIGPNAVVITDVPAHASVIAAPSRILRLRSSEDGAS
jgi:serine O-acetyltransferase